MKATIYADYLQTDHWKTLRIQALERAGYRCQVCNNPDGLDVHHRTYERVGNELLDDLTVLCDRCHTLFHEQASVKPVPTLQQTLQELHDCIELRKERAHEFSGLPTGFIDLDNLTAGLQNSELIIVAARPTVGKTSFVLNVTRNIILQQNHPVFFVSLELSCIELTERLLCCQAQVNSQSIRKGHLDSEDMKKLGEAAGLLTEAPLFIESQTTSLTHIVSKARQLHADQGIKILVLDCFDSLDHGVNYQQIEMSARRLRQLAKELEIPVIATARIKRSSEDRHDHRPRLADLAHAGALEHEADTILLLHRPELHEPGQYEGLAEVLLAKQRNGPTGDVNLQFSKQFSRFQDYVIEPSPSFGNL